MYGHCPFSADAFYNQAHQFYKPQDASSELSIKLQIDELVKLIKLISQLATRWCFFITAIASLKKHEGLISLVI
nr:hypothetical protein [Mucilaginibacter sp. SP1R1]